jgi:hypothetical protein
VKFLKGTIGSWWLEKNKWCFYKTAVGIIFLNTNLMSNVLAIGRIIKDVFLILVLVLSENVLYLCNRNNAEVW